MDAPPLLAQRRQDNGQCALHTINGGTAEPVAFAKLWRAVRAMQNEHRLTATPDDMDMRGTMVVGIDHNPIDADAPNGRHDPA